MVLFWVASAVMLLGAMGFVLLPMLRAAGADPEAARRSALLQAHRSGVLTADEYTAKLATFANRPAGASPVPRLAIALAALLLPFGAILSYKMIGEPHAFDAMPSAAAQEMNAALAAQGSNPPTGAAPDMQAAVAGLAERLKNQPDDLDGWMLLGRAYKSTERFEPAREALANAYRLAPDDADVLIEYAEAVVLASPSRRFEGEPLTLLQRALSLQPDSQRGLWLLGISAYQAGDFAQAAQTWERLLGTMPDNAEARAALLERVADARTRAGLPALAQAPVAASAAAATAAPPFAAPAATASSTAGNAPAAGAPAAAGGASLTVRVDIAPELKAKLGPSDVVFIFARAAEGPRMPLAIQRLPAASLPVTVTLDDSTSMMPQMTLSAMPRVVVGARISKTGQAIAQPGDFETLSAPLSNNQAEPVTLVIDRVVP